MKKRLNVWILQTGEPLIIDNDNLRFMRGMNLANALIEKGHEVLFFSSNFNHQKKSHREYRSKLIKYNSKLKFYLIDSSGYKNNLSIKRFYDHFLLAKNLNKILNSIELVPDVIFIGYPPIEVAYVMSNWAKKKKIPYILDIKDKWPDLIVNIFPKIIQPVVKIILSPYYFCFKQTIKNASSITSMSDSFINWSYKFSYNKNYKNNLVLPLVSKKMEIINDDNDNWCNLNKIDRSTFNIVFVGSLSRSFDFETVINCFSNIQNSNIKLIICGDGEFKHKLTEYSKKVKNIIFTGWIDSSKLATIASKSKLAIAPYKNFENFIDNIPNKIGDYLSYGLPILSPLKGEIANLLKKHQIGLSYEDKSSISLEKKILMYFNNDKLLNLHKKNTKEIYDSYFNFDLVYKKAVTLVEKISNEKI